MQLNKSKSLCPAFFTECLRKGVRFEFESELVFYVCGPRPLLTPLQCLWGGSEVSGGSRGPPNGGPGASGVYSPCLGLYVLSLAEKGAGEDFEISRSASLRLHKVEVIVRSTTIEYD